MRLLSEYPVGSLRNAVTINHILSVAKVVRHVPGIGKPTQIFDTLPGNPVIVDFSMFPQYVLSTDETANATMINEMPATPPIDAVTFAD